MKTFTCILLIILGSCTPETVTAPDEAVVSVSRKVKTVTVKSKHIHSEFPVNGVVSYGQTRKVHAGFSGFVARVYADDGEYVHRGDTLLVFDKTDATIDRLLAEARVNKLKIEFESERLGYLDSEGTNTDQSLYFLTGLAEAELMLRKARHHEGQAVLLSPCDGIIFEWKVAIGEYYVQGAPLGRLVTENNKEARVYFLEGERQLLQKGMKGWARIPVSGAVFPCRLVRWSPVFDDKGRLATYWSVPDTSLVMPGQALVIYPEFKTRKGIILPLGAIAGDTDSPVVFTVESDTARYNLVQTQWYDEDSVEVISGLSDGQRVIISGQIAIHEGTPVEEIL